MHLSTKSRVGRLYARMLMSAVVLTGTAAAAVILPAAPAQAYATSAIADRAETYADYAHGGQCKTFVGNVLQAVAGFYPPGYQQGFANAGATEVSPANAARGDIIQVTPAGSTDATAESMYNPYVSSAKLHTAIVRGPRNADGTFNVIDSNWSATNDMLVRRHAFNPYTWGSGSIIKIWRFGTTAPSGSPARSDVDKNAGADLFLMTSQPAGSSGATLLSTYVSFIPSSHNWDGTGYGWSGVTPMVGDVNGDKRADLVFLTNEGANGTKAFVATAHATGFNSPQLWWNGVGWGYTGIKASLGDVDNNGGEDLVIMTNEAAGSKAFALRSTYGTFLSPQLWWDGTGFGWSGVTPLVSDVNGDKKADYVFLTNEGANGTKAFVAISNGSTFGAPQLWWNGAGWGYTGIMPTLGDVDGNGGADLIVTTPTATGAAGHVLLSTYGTFLAPQYWWDGTGFGWSGITPFAGDVNGDLKADYALLTNEGANGTKAFVATSTGGAFLASQLWWNGTGWSYTGTKAYLK